MSVCTIESDDEYEQVLYRSEYGRELNNSSDVYVFPADPEEKTRLCMFNLPHKKLLGCSDSLSDRQNLFIRATVGAYPLAVRGILERDPHDKAVLDLGCGDGTW